MKLHTHTVSVCNLYSYVHAYVCAYLCILNEIPSNFFLITAPTVISIVFPSMVPDVKVDVNTININGNNVTLTLSWGEPFNNIDPIVSYTVSCSGDDTCPQNFTTTDNTTRSYTITNLTPMTTYTFSVVATNSIGSGEAGVMMISTPAIFITTTSSINMCTIASSMDMTTAATRSSTYVNNFYVLSCVSRLMIVLSHKTK